MPAEGTLRDGTAAGFELIETMRWEPDAGFVRLGLHLGRLLASAHALGFAADADAVAKALRQCEGARTPLRVRLALARDGEVNVATAPFVPLPAGTEWTLRIARARSDSADPLLRHKTTRRQGYEAARSEFSHEEADEVLLLNERGEACEGAITNLFIDIGEPVLATPALGCGLLPGVLRGEMIEQGLAKEAILTPADLRAARAVHVGNSLRGLIRARLA
ncbi:aminotransferase class IV family protein [Mesorhizobium sp. ZMM04-5]|uniref:Probable branched-chain-amino-acid aminotransferase n=1 Tax=Mesorhizobium marinum TaxID=3228790 RepID=A0ABV3QTN2_9HYPH